MTHRESRLGTSPSVKILTQPNLGLVSVLNRGLSEATGEYLVILSADDVLQDVVRRDAARGTARAARQPHTPTARWRTSAPDLACFRAKPFSPALLAGRELHQRDCARRAAPTRSRSAGSSPTLERVGRLGLLAAPARVGAVRSCRITTSSPLSAARDDEPKPPVALECVHRTIRAVAGRHPDLYGRRPHRRS